jgi:ArsR family transcriptional regulator
MIQQSKVSACFNALSNKCRLNALLLLVESGDEGIVAGHLARKLKRDQAAVSNHMKVLHDTGLVRSKRRGKNVIYHAEHKKVMSVLDFIKKKLS